MRHAPRISTLLLLAALAAGTLAPDAGAAPGNKPKNDTTAQLVRPLVAAPDDDAKGTLRIRSLSKKDQRFEVKVQNVDVAVVHELWVADALDVMTFIDVLEVKGSKLRLKLNAKPGKKAKPLPFDVEQVDELVGRAVEIRAEGLVVLGADVPVFVAKGKPQKGQADLADAPASPDPAIDGEVKIVRKAWKGQERFAVELDGAPADEVLFQVFLETAVGSGVLEVVGAVEPEESFVLDGDASFAVKTKDGSPLPFGVASLDDLVGRAVEVRDGADALYLSGTVPAFGDGDFDDDDDDDDD